MLKIKSRHLLLTVLIGFPFSASALLPDPDLFDGSPKESKESNEAQSTAQQQSQQDSQEQQSQQQEQNKSQSEQKQNNPQAPQAGNQSNQEAPQTGAPQAGGQNQNTAQNPQGGQAGQQIPPQTNGQAGGGLPQTGGQLPNAGQGQAAGQPKAGGSFGDLIDLSVFGIGTTSSQGGQPTQPQQPSPQNRTFESVKIGQGGSQQIELPKDYEKETSIEHAQEKVDNQISRREAEAASRQSQRTRNSGSETGEAIPEGL